MTDSLNPARTVTEFLVINLSENLPPGLLLVSDSGTDLVVREGAETTPCLDLGLISPPENAIDFAGLIHVALDGVQAAVSRIMELPWPQAGTSLDVFNAYSVQVGTSVSAGYGTVDNPVLPLPPLPLPNYLT